MSPEQAWDSNPIVTGKRIRLLREAKDPESKKKESAWTRKEILEARRTYNA